jgi:hypothetical protein
MAKLPPRERAAILKRVKEINAKIADSQLTIERYDILHKEREELHKKLLEDRASC